MQIYCVSHLQGLDFDLVRRESTSQFCSKPKRKIIIHLDPSQLLLLSRHAKLCLCIENGPHAYIIPFFFFLNIRYYFPSNFSISLCRYLKISFHPFAKNQPATFIHVFSSICKKHLNIFILYLFIIYLQNQPTFIHSFIDVSPLQLFGKLILHSCISLPPPMHHLPHTVPLSLSLSPSPRPPGRHK